jgi:hypothetical protein
MGILLRREQKEAMEMIITVNCAIVGMLGNARNAMEAVCSEWMLRLVICVMLEARGMPGNVRKAISSLLVSICLLSIAHTLC